MFNYPLQFVKDFTNHKLLQVLLYVILIDKITQNFSGY